ncbi:hypothetical protein M3J09_001566 [Ascochyta lentis]
MASGEGEGEAYLAKFSSTHSYPLSIRTAVPAQKQCDTFTPVNLDSTQNLQSEDDISARRETNQQLVYDTKHKIGGLDDILNGARDQILVRQLRHEQTAATVMASDPRRKNADVWEIGLLLDHEFEMELERDFLIAKLARLKQEVWRDRLESARLRTVHREQRAKSNLRDQVEFD